MSRALHARLNHRGIGELGDAGKRRLESLNKLLDLRGGRIISADDPE